MNLKDPRKTRCKSCRKVLRMKLSRVVKVPTGSEKRNGCQLKGGGGAVKAAQAVLPSVLIKA